MLFIFTLDKILSMMKDFKVDDKRFEVLKEARIRELKNMEMDQPHKQGIITFFGLFYFLGLVFVLLAIIYNKSFLWVDCWSNHKIFHHQFPSKDWITFDVYTLLLE